MEIKEPKNKNYCAIVVTLKDFVTLEKCDKLKGTIIFNNHVIVSKDTEPGTKGLYFPLETALSKEFLSTNNLYRKPEFGNVDPTQTGMFDENGRVRAIKLRGYKSEGFFIPISCLYQLNPEYMSLNDGVEFDELNPPPHMSCGPVSLCSKYVPKGNKGTGTQNKKQRQARVEDQIKDGQFRLHYDTENLRRNVHKIDPEDYISLSDKWHGTSAVFMNAPVERKLSFIERLMGFVGVSIDKYTYGLVYSSRRVVKGIDGVEKTNAAHYYDENIWKTVADEIKDRVPKGYTIYGEIVGYTPGGSPIQKGYHYGCAAGQHKLLVYRVTSTNLDGLVIELSWLQLREFCQKFGFELVKELWYGKARDLVIGGIGNHWHEELLGYLERTFVKDEMCPYNNKEVPAEGIVVRVDKLDMSEAYKVKSFKFLEWETKALDAGEGDFEDQTGE